MKLKVIVMLLWVLFVFALVLGQAAAPTQFIVDGSTSWQRARIVKLERQLNFTQEPMPDTWEVHIIPQQQFIENTREAKLETSSAYSYFGLDQTYINENYLDLANDLSVRHTLAHEAGHMICNCSNEERAEAIAHQLEK